MAQMEPTANIYRGTPQGDHLTVNQCTYQCTVCLARPAAPPDTYFDYQATALMCRTCESLAYLAKTARQQEQHTSLAMHIENIIVASAEETFGALLAENIIATAMPGSIPVNVLQSPLPIQVSTSPTGGRVWRTVPPQSNVPIISKQAIQEQIQTMKPRASPGPDGWRPSAPPDQPGSSSSRKQQPVVKAKALQSVPKAVLQRQEWPQQEQMAKAFILQQEQNLAAKAKAKGLSKEYLQGAQMVKDLNQQKLQKSQGTSPQQKLAEAFSQSFELSGHAKSAELRNQACRQLQETQEGKQALHTDPNDRKRPLYSEDTFSFIPNSRPKTNKEICDLGTAATVRIDSRQAPNDGPSVPHWKAGSLPTANAQMIVRQYAADCAQAINK